MCVSVDIKGRRAFEIAARGLTRDLAHSPEPPPIRRASVAIALVQQ